MRPPIKKTLSVRLLQLKPLSIPLNSTVTFVFTFFKSLLIFHKNGLRFSSLCICHATESNATVKYKQITVKHNSVNDFIKVYTYIVSFNHMFRL